jgi:hypothetical protein
VCRCQLLAVQAALLHTRCCSCRQPCQLRHRTCSSWCTRVGSSSR